MIYTSTFNPSVDYYISLNKFSLNKINHLEESNFSSGGKGINISKILTKLNVDNIALGFIGGFTGKYLKNDLDRMNVKNDFLELNETTRINVKIKEKKETAIDGKAPTLEIKNIIDLITKLKNLNEDDFVIVSGSIPSSVTFEMIDKLFSYIKTKGAKFIIDTSSPYLLKLLKYQPLLIKPNLEELENLIEEKINSKEELIKIANKIIKDGCNNIIVSLGSKGSIFVNKDIVIESKAIKTEVIHTIGAGDAMVAGFIYEYQKSKDVKLAYYMASTIAILRITKDLYKTNEIIDLYTKLKKRGTEYANMLWYWKY